MKRKVIPLLVLAMLALGLAVPSVASGETFKKQCADIESGGGQTFLNGSGTYDLSFALQTPSKCGGIVFTLYVYANETDCSGLAIGEVGAPEATLSVKGASLSADQVHGQVVYSAPGVDADGVVWVFATSTQGNHIIDRAPDAGCTDYDTNAPGKGFS
jgi:hypothetical protein